MPIRNAHLLASLVILIITLPGCWGGGPRRPLFGSSHDAPAPTEQERAQLEARKRAVEEASKPKPAKEGEAPAGPVRVGTTPAPRAPGEKDDPAALLATLDQAKGPDRRTLVDRLVAHGESARAPVERALEDQTFRQDVLREVLARLDAKRRAQGQPKGADPQMPGAMPRRRSVESPWVAEKYRLAVDRFLAGDAMGCEHTLEAILALEPDAALRPKIERLRRRAREQIVAEAVARASLEPRSRLLFPRQPLAATVVIENKGNETLELRHAAAKGAPFGEVEVEYEELAPDGTHAKRRLTRPVRFEKDARLGPGERLTVELDLPAAQAHQEKPPRIVGRYRLYGRLRPSTLLHGDEPLPYFLRIQPVEVVVLDEADRDLAEEPRKKLEAAVAAALAARKEAKPEEVAEGARQAFTAACVLARDDRASAIEACAVSLEATTDGPLAQALCAALSRVTGEPVSYTRAEWLEWWKGKSARPGTTGGAAPRAPGGDEPDPGEEGR